MAMFENGVHYPVVFAGGTINADIYARNTTSDPDGGRIGRVGAHGDIAGLFKAQSSIDEVFSAGDIDAIFDAPLVYPPRENDASVITDHPLPDTPDSIRPDVLAEAATGYADVFETRDDLYDAFQRFLDTMRERTIADHPVMIVIGSHPPLDDPWQNRIPENGSLGTSARDS